MLITFKSKAAADIIMYKIHAQRLLDLLGKEIDRGIITSEETGKAIAAIEAAIKDSQAHTLSDGVTNDIAAHPEPNSNHEHESVEPVSFSARAFPLLEMLREANKQGCNVVWGV